MSGVGRCLHEHSAAGIDHIEIEAKTEKWFGKDILLNRSAPVGEQSAKKILPHQSRVDVESGHAPR